MIKHNIYTFIFYLILNDSYKIDYIYSFVGKIQVNKDYWTWKNVKLDSTRILFLFIVKYTYF